jgi:hypothetical protein
MRLRIRVQAGMRHRTFKVSFILGQVSICIDSCCRFCLTQGAAKSGPPQGQPAAPFGTTGNIIRIPSFLSMPKKCTFIQRSYPLSRSSCRSRSSSLAPAAGHSTSCPSIRPRPISIFPFCIIGTSLGSHLRGCQLCASLPLQPEINRAFLLRNQFKPLPLCITERAIEFNSPCIIGLE